MGVLSGRILQPMNEQNPAAPPVEMAPQPAYKDRSTGLIIFGILTLLLGCLAGLFMLLMLFGQMMAAKAPDAPPVNHAAMLPGMAVYGLLAVALVWLGIGSIMARRWARALLLIFSWSWLIMGIFMTAVMPFFMAKVDCQPAAQCQNRPVGNAAGSHHRHGHRHDHFLLRFFCPRAGGVDVLL